MEPFTEHLWDDVLHVLNLRHTASPDDCARMALELLDPERPARARDLQVVAAWLGRDRESRRVTGCSPREAIEEVFQQEWEDVNRAKGDGK